MAPVSAATSEMGCNLDRRSKIGNIEGWSFDVDDSNDSLIPCFRSETKNDARKG